MRKKDVKTIEIAQYLQTDYFVCADGTVFKRLRGTVSSDGYLKTSLHFGHKRKTIRHTHRLVAEIYCEKPEGCNSVDHISREKLDNGADNLQWVTTSENSRLVFARGCKRRHDKLTDADVVAIRADARPSNVLAEIYGVGKSHITNLRNGTIRRANLDGGYSPRPDTGNVVVFPNRVGVPRRKLSDEDVAAIRVDKRVAREVAAEFGISAKYVYAIRTDNARRKHGVR